MVERIRSQRREAEKYGRGRLSFDSFQNFAAKVGIGTDNLSSGNTYGFNPISRVRTLLEWMYRGSWLCGVGVDVVADDMTREWIEIEDADIDAEEVERMYTMMRRMQIPQSFNAMGKWARLYGGAVNVIMIQGQRLDTPLRIETVKPGQFKGLITLDRWMLTPDLNSAVKDPGPDFGNPEWYTIDAQSPNLPIPRQRVHWTRLARMEGVELPFWQKQSENMWGISVIERLYDRLTAFDSSTQGAAQMAFRAYLRTLKVKNLRDIIANGGEAYTALTENMNLIRRYQSNEGITLIDGEDEFEGHQNTFAGMADIINATGEQISGALQVPLTRLFGQSPAGLNADGDSAMRTYEDNIKRQQERWFRRPLDVIVPLIAVNCEVELGEGWSLKFKSLRQMTEEQQADINTKDTAALTSVQSTGLVPGAVFLKELRQSGRKTGRWTNISDKDIKEAEKNDKVPSPSELGVNPRTGQPLPGAGGGDDEEEGENPDKVTNNKKPKGGKAKKSDDRQVLVDFQGIPVFIENHRGTMRKGNGWETLMPADYGFIEGVGSAEGAFEQLDCYVGESPDAGWVFIVDQTNLHTGAFDEHKCMLGFVDKQHALATYEQSFSDGKGADRLGAITAVSVDTFKGWLKAGDHTQPATGQF